ncbi:uncharacterized protein LOC124442887 [Xenia sp. Carnegie-2017]|uniref:uncharacterized protein LOC124442887 n=1 Tax=Xenia sp. Carnegie-2017 TaxID=2897299 RepID=UPI001F03E62A|nr:uncharacterized protein LOC124442887 [Xenia sp. Carnegie-2017]
MARMKRAVDVEETAKSDIEKLCRCFPSHSISIDDIREWMKDESTFFGREVETEEEDWKCKFVGDVEKAKDSKGLTVFEATKQWAGDKRKREDRGDPGVIDGYKDTITTIIITF